MKLELLKNGVDQIATFLKIATKLKMEKFAININQKRLTLRFIDPSHVSMSVLELRNNKHYKLDNLVDSLEGKDFELQVKDVDKILSRVEENTTVMSAAVEGGDLMGINFTINSNETTETIKEIQIPAFDYEMGANLPALSFEKDAPNIRMEVDNIVESLNEINDYETEILQITNDGAVVKLEATSSENNRKRIKINKFESIDFQNLNEGKTKSVDTVYSMDFLNKIVVSNNAYEKIDVQLDNKMPICFTYVNENAGDSNLICYVAPRTED